MKHVLKWEIPVDGNWHEIPALVGGWTVGHQREGYLTIWAEAKMPDWSGPADDIRVRVFGTYQGYANGTTYLGSSFDPRGFVWHLIQGAP